MLRNKECYLFGHGLCILSPEFDNMLRPPSSPLQNSKKVLLSFLMPVQLFLSLLFSNMHSIACIHMKGEKKKKEEPKNPAKSSGAKGQMWWLWEFCVLE